jgi:two-component system sensor histidine kinase DevS
VERVDLPASVLRPSGLEEAAILALVDAAPDGILMADEDGRIIFANRQLDELFGFDPGELVGRSVDDLLPEHVRQVHRAHRTRYRAEPRLRSMGAGLTLLGRRADGTDFPVEISLSPLPSDDGLRVVAVVRDVSERLLAEAQDREVRNALDATRDAVLVLDADTLRFTYANEGATEQVGYRRDELLGMTMLHIAPEYTESQLRELLGPLARGEQASMMFTTVHRHRDGTDLPVEILMQAIPGDDGSPVRYIQIVRDVRERVEAEERLRRAEQHLRIVEDRERIARDLHDIVIQKLFAAGMTIQSVSARTADVEHRRRLATAVDDLDDTIREIRSVIFSLQADARDGGGVRAEVLRIADDERAALGFEPRIRFEGPIDAMAEEIAQEVLPSLREALSNVAKHAGASAVEIVVDVGDMVTLRVLDNGRGMPVTFSHGHGLRNLSERATKLGGTCQVSTQPQGGTAVEWQVPNAVPLRSTAPGGCRGADRADRSD